MNRNSPHFVHKELKKEGSSNTHEVEQWKLEMSSDSNEKQINKIWNFPLSEQKNVSTQNILLPLFSYYCFFL